MTSNEKVFGLLGKHLQHSFSKQYFDALFEKHAWPYRFDLFEVPSSEAVKEFFKEHTYLNGLAVTFPYKKMVMEMMDELDQSAEQTGAVNCIHFGEKRKGYNTDVIGLEAALKPIIPTDITNALILGNGGAAQAAKYVMRKLQIPFTVVTRQSTKDSITYQDLSKEIIQSHQLIIHCTPVGTYPNVDTMVELPVQFLDERHVVFDMVYNPGTTMLMEQCRLHGARVKNGLDMLYRQADANLEIWLAE